MFSYRSSYLGKNMVYDFYSYFLNRIMHYISCFLCSKQTKQLLCRLLSEGVERATQRSNDSLQVESLGFLITSKTGISYSLFRFDRNQLQLFIYICVFCVMLQRCRLK